MKNMNLVYIILLLICCLPNAQLQYNIQGEFISFSNFHDYSSTGHLLQLETTGTILNTPKAANVNFYIKSNDVSNVKCWVNFNFLSSNSSHSNYSRYVMLEQGTQYQSYGSSGVQENSYTKTKYINFPFYIFVDDDNSSSQVDSLCGQDKILVSWYGGRSDAYGVSGIDADINAIRNNHLTLSESGKYYMCIDPVAADKKATNYTTTGLNQETYIIQLSITGICERVSVTDSQYVPIAGTGILGFFPSTVLKFTSPSSNAINRTLVSNVVVSTPTDIKNSEWFNSVINYAGEVLKGVLSGLNDQVRGAACNLPEPFPTILKTLSSIIDFIIMFIGVFLIYQVIKYFLTFRKSLQRSLSKAAIVFMQMLIFTIILVSFFYAITHTQTYCGLKAGVTIFTLKQVGIQFIIPQSITDIPAALWDLMYISVLQGTVSDCNKDGMGYGDCSVYFGQPDTTFNLTCTEGSPGCQSLIIRITEIVILLSVIIVFIATLWEITRHIFRKTKQFEEEVRHPDESEYEDSDEEP